MNLFFNWEHFFFIQSDETAPSGDPYYYYGFVNAMGMIQIMRTDTNSNNARYYFENGNFDTIWANKSTYTYGYPKN